MSLRGIIVPAQFSMVRRSDITSKFALTIFVINTQKYDEQNLRVCLLTTSTKKFHNPRSRGLFNYDYQMEM